MVCRTDAGVPGAGDRLTTDSRMKKRSADFVEAGASATSGSPSIPRALTSRDPGCGFDAVCAARPNEALGKSMEARLNESVSMRQFSWFSAFTLLAQLVSECPPYRIGKHLPARLPYHRHPLGGEQANHRFVGFLRKQHRQPGMSCEAALIIQ